MKINQFCLILVAFFILSCSKSPKELFDLAENNLKLDNADEAILNLETLLLKHPNDSLASKAQYKVSSIYFNWKDEILSGYEALSKTTKNYPNSKQAKQAQREIDYFPKFLVDKAESLRKKKKLKESVNHLMYLIDNYPKNELTPKGQYMLGDLYMNDFRDFEIAIQEYRKVINNHKGSLQEPHAQFMIGYIYANVLNDIDNAKIEYEKFVRDFKDHELAPSVKFELEYLGKSIDEIPVLKHITS